MTKYLIYRHGSNAANQSRINEMAIDIIEAKSQEAAKTIAAENHTVYNNQFLSAVPESKAKQSDWDYVTEMQVNAAAGLD